MDNLKPSRGEYKQDYVARFMADPSMAALYPREYWRRQAADRQWEMRPWAPGVKSRWPLEQRRLQSHRDKGLL